MCGEAGYPATPQGKGTDLMRRRVSQSILFRKYGAVSLLRGNASLETESGGFGCPALVLRERGSPTA
jgi:hypothetical protein